MNGYVGVELNKATSHSKLVTKLDLVPFNSPASKSLVKPLAVNALIELHAVNFLYKMFEIHIVKR